MPVLDGADAAERRAIIAAMTNDDMPLDPELDDLPRELADCSGPFTIRARDPKTGEVFEAPTTRENVATGLADR